MQGLSPPRRGSQRRSSRPCACWPHALPPLPSPPPPATATATPATVSLPPATWFPSPPFPPSLLAAAPTGDCTLFLSFPPFLPPTPSTTVVTELSIPLAASPPLPLPLPLRHLPSLLVSPPCPPPLPLCLPSTGCVLILCSCLLCPLPPPACPSAAGECSVGWGEQEKDMEEEAEEDGLTARWQAGSGPWLSS